MSPVPGLLEALTPRPRYQGPAVQWGRDAAAGESWGGARLAQPSLVPSSAARTLGPSHPGLGACSTARVTGKEQGTMPLACSWSPACPALPASCRWAIPGPPHTRIGSAAHLATPPDCDAWVGGGGGGGGRRGGRPSSSRGVGNKGALGFWATMASIDSEGLGLK